MTNRQEIRYIAAIAGVITLVCLPLVLLGPQTGHSLKFNLTWAPGFAQQLLTGELYPRWIVDLNEGAGSPVFFYYAPFPFYVTSLGVLACGGCGTAIHLGISEWLLILMSAGSFYVFARQYGRPVAAAIGSVLFALMPYHFLVDILFRQAIGEAAAYIWIPLIILFTDRLGRGASAAAGLAVTYALLILTHLPTALLFSMFLLCYAVVLAYEHRSPRRLAWFAAGILCGIALSAVYLVTALSSLDLISSDRLWTTFEEYDRWFFFAGKESPSPEFSRILFSLMVLSSVAFAGMWFMALRECGEAKRTRLIYSMAMVAGAWFLMLPISGFLWEILPILQKVQFPWRAGVILDFAIAATSVAALAQTITKSARSVVVFASIGMLLVVSLGPGTMIYLYNSGLAGDDAHQARLADLVRSGNDAVEYFPSQVTLDRTEVLSQIAALGKIGHDEKTAKSG